MNDNPQRTNVVLVHGGFVDGSGWQGVYEALTADGYRVAIVQNPTLSLEDDAAATRRVIDGLGGPVILVGATVTEVPGSHSVYLSQPQAVASLIKRAAG